MPILASRWGPRLYYDNKCICKSALYPYDDTKSEDELEYNDSPESNGENDGELTADESSYEAPNYWYMDNQLVQYISDADSDTDSDVDWDLRQVEKVELVCIRESNFLRSRAQ